MITLADRDKKIPETDRDRAWRVDREDLPWAERRRRNRRKATYGGYYNRMKFVKLLNMPEKNMWRSSRDRDAAILSKCLLLSAILMYRSPLLSPRKLLAKLRYIMCGNDSVFQFLQDVLRSDGSFPSNISMQEVMKQIRQDGRMPKCQERIRNEAWKMKGIQSYFIKRIEKFIISKNRRWSDGTKYWKAALHGSNRYVVARTRRRDRCCKTGSWCDHDSDFSLLFRLLPGWSGFWA